MLNTFYASVTLLGVGDRVFFVGFVVVVLKEMNRRVPAVVTQGLVLETDT